MQVIVAGQAASPTTQALLHAAHAAPAFDKAVILIDPCNPDSVAFWKQHNPEAWTMVDAHFQRSGPAAAAAAGGLAPAGAAAAEGLDDLGMSATGVAAAAAGASETAAEVAASEVAAAGGAAARFTPAAFVCQNFTCQAPTSSPEKVYDLLRAQGGAVKLQPFKI